MRYLKIFNNKTERNNAIETGELSPNSVSIWGSDVDRGVAKIEFGEGNGDHQLQLGTNDYGDFDDESSVEDSNE